MATKRGEGQGYFHSETREECIQWVHDEYGPDCAEVARRFIDGETADRTMPTVEEAFNSYTF